MGNEDKAARAHFARATENRGLHAALLGGLCAFIAWRVSISYSFFPLPRKDYFEILNLFTLRYSGLILSGAVFAVLIITTGVAAFRRGPGLAILGACITLFFCALLIPQIHGLYEPARYIEAKQNLHSIQLALERYDQFRQG